MTVRFHQPSRPGLLLQAFWLLIASLALMVLQANAGQAAKPFPVDQFSYYLSDYDYQLGKLAKTVTKTAAEIETDIATAETTGNARLTAAAIEQLLTKRPSDAALWLKLAQQLSLSTPINDQDGYAIPSLMIGAGLRAYTLARAPQDEAAALVVAGQGFVKRENWRPALQAYKESLKLAEEPTLRETYETMRVEHGFRITDYKVDNDATPPRVCFELSDPVARTVNDFTPYFTQEPGPVAAAASASRIDRVPLSSILWLECTTRSRIASASVGSLR